MQPELCGHASLQPTHGILIDKCVFVSNIASLAASVATWRIMDGQAGQTQTLDQSLDGSKYFSPVSQQIKVDDSGGQRPSSNNYMQVKLHVQLVACTCTQMCTKNLANTRPGTCSFGLTKKWGFIILSSRCIKLQSSSRLLSCICDQKKTNMCL